MIYPLYAIKDQHVGFGQITISDNDAVAMRHFQNACEQPNSIFITAPSDFELFSIGEYDTKTGEITSISPRLICSAKDFVNKGV